AVRGHVDVERAGDGALHFGELPQAVRVAGRLRVQTRVVDGERRLLTHEGQRVDFFLGERPLGPVVHRKRAVDTLLGAQRRRRHRLEAFALDLSAAVRRQPDVRVAKDVGGRDGASLEYGSADGPATP